MQLSQRKGGVPRSLLGQIRAGGEPMLVRVDEIISQDTIRASLLIGSLGFRENQSIVLKTGQDVSASRSLTTAIAGNDKMARLVPADILAFENVYDYEDVVYAESISARTNDLMTGKVQVVTAMAKPSASRVNKKGALQSLVITNGRNAKTARTPDKVRDFMAWVRREEWPGGAPGMLIRDRGGRVIKEFFEEGRNTINALVEDLEHDGIFTAAEPFLELIPAWRLPMGRSQVLRDVGDPKVEVDSHIGPFTRRFVSSDTRGFPGFLPCLIVLCEEDQWEFGAKTGRKVMVAAGVQPIDKLPAVSRDQLPTSIRPCKGTPNTINKLYNEETMIAMAKERRVRCPAEPDAASAAKPSGGQTARPRTFMGGTGQGARPRAAEPSAPPLVTGPRRFGR